MQKIKFVGLAFLILFAASACSQGDRDGNLMVFHRAHKDPVKYWDPANAYDSISLDVVPSIFESLYQYDYLDVTYHTVPLLAADMPKYSADRLTVTIPLKRGIHFTDDPCFEGGKGRELKAQDFVYSFKRLALPSLQSQGWWIFDGKVAGINAYYDKMVKADKKDIPKLFEEPVEGLKALDDYTLQIKLVKPYPQLLYILTMGFTAAVPREGVDKYKDEDGNYNDHPVGTGPYTLKSWDRTRQIVMERNPSYHADFYPTKASEKYRKMGMLADAGKPLPFIDRLVFDVIKERQPEWLNFMKGKEDILELPKDNFGQAMATKDELRPELKEKQMLFDVENGVTFYYISFNVKDKLIGSSKYLRQALSSAIDRDKWIEIFNNGAGEKMTTSLPPGTADRPAHSVLKYDYNVARGKELLKKAGYPEGKGLPVINFDLRGADSVNRQIGEFMQREWQAIGVNINVIYNTFPAYLEKAKQGNLQVAFGGWNIDYPDGENVFQLLYGPNKAPGPNEANFDNPEANKLYEQIAIMESGPARAALVKKMDDLLQEEVPWAYGYYYANYKLSQPWLKNFRASEIILNSYKYLRVDRELKKKLTN